MDPVASLKEFFHRVKERMELRHYAKLDGYTAPDGSKAYGRGAWIRRGLASITTLRSSASGVATRVDSESAKIGVLTVYAINSIRTTLIQKWSQGVGRILGPRGSTETVQAKAEETG